MTCIRCHEAIEPGDHIILRDWHPNTPDANVHRSCAYDLEYANGAALDPDRDPIPPKAMTHPLGEPA